jgi:uncharacterized protein with ACT and thioredoxin-like domain
MLNRKEMIEKLAEHDLECFYSNSFKKQESELKSIFMEFYGTTSEDVLRELMIDFNLIEEKTNA